MAELQSIKAADSTTLFCIIHQLHPCPLFDAGRRRWLLTPEVRHVGGHHDAASPRLLQKPPCLEHGWQGGHDRLVQCWAHRPVQNGRREGRDLGDARNHKRDVVLVGVGGGCLDDLPHEICRRTGADAPQNPYNIMTV